MKLKELLKVIPDDYGIGLMDSDPDNYALMVFGNKDGSIERFGKKAGMPPAHVKNLTVVSIHPGANTWLPSGVTMYGDDSAELHVTTHLLIELDTTEEEDEE